VGQSIWVVVRVVQRKKTIIIRDPYCYWTVSDEDHIFWVNNQAKI